MKIRGLMVFCWLIVGLVSQSQPLRTEKLRFLRITSEDGLSQNTVNHIYQDQLGYIWFCTQDGLNKFDGYEFTHYRPSDKDSLSISDNYVLRIVPDTNDNFWVICRYGINYFNRKTETFHKYHRGNPSALIYGLDVFWWNKQPYVSFFDASYKLPRSAVRQFTQLTEPFTTQMHNHTPFFSSTGDGHYIGLGNKELFVFNKEFEITQSYPQEVSYTKVQGIRKFSNGILACYGNTVFEYNRESFSLDTVYHSLQNGTVQDAIKLKTGEIWVAHEQGIDILYPPSEKVALRFHPDRDNGLSSSLIHALFEDQAGNIWVGTSNGGLNVLPATSPCFTHYAQKDGLNTNQVWALAFRKDSSLLIGTEKGVSVLQDGEIRALVPPLPQPLENQKITALAEDSTGRIWIGTAKDGAYLRSKTGTCVKLPLGDWSATNKTVSCFAFGDSTVWMGTFGCLHQYNYSGDLLREYTFSELDSSSYYRYLLSVFNDGEFVFFGGAYGFFSLHKKTDSLHSYLYTPNSTEETSPSFQFVNAIHKLESDKFVLTTFGGGINLFDRSTEKFTFFRTANGLPNEVIAGAEKYKNQLWVSHNLGLSRFDLASQSIQNYSYFDGLPFNEFALGASASQGNKIAFGGTKGIVVFNDQHFESATSNLSPFLTELVLNYGKTQNESTQFPERVSEIALKPNIKNLSFQFSANDHIHAKQLTFEYRLLGFNTTWVQTPLSERRATYSNLPSGEYTFQVRVTDQNGHLSPQLLTIPLVVIPPLWQRWWFLSLMAFLLLVFITVTVRYFSQLKIKRRLKEMEVRTRIQQERQRISMDLHDNVGAQITYLISNLDRLALEEEQASTPFQNLSRYARSAMSDLRDTVWAVKKETMPLSQIKNRIERFGNKLTVNSGVTFSVKTKGKHSPSLAPTAALNTMRIAQEAITNAFKYANATAIDVTMACSTSTLHLEIKDNGIGFKEDELDPNDQNGIQNMKERTKQVNGLLTIDSTLGIGTLISFSIPLNEANAL